MVDSAFSENEQALEGKGIQNSNRWQANLVFIRIEWRTNTVWHVTYAVSMFRPYKITMTCIFSGSDVGKNIFLGKEFSVCLWNCFFVKKEFLLHIVEVSWSVVKFFRYFCENIIILFHVYSQTYYIGQLFQLKSFRNKLVAPVSFWDQAQKKMMLTFGKIEKTDHHL